MIYVECRHDKDLWYQKNPSHIRLAGAAVQDNWTVHNVDFQALSLRLDRRKSRDFDGSRWEETKLT